MYHPFRLLATLALLAAPTLAPASAWAKGPGEYDVHGTNSGDQSTYDGTVSVVQTGDGTWRVKQKIAGDSYEGYGIGDGNVLAVTYVSGGETYVSLYVAKPDGSYEGMWAQKGDKKLSIEAWTPK